MALLCALRRSATTLDASLEERMSTVDQKLADLGIALPTPAAPVAN
jgi:hypothetical protein